MCFKNRLGSFLIVLSIIIDVVRKALSITSRWSESSVICDVYRCLTIVCDPFFHYRWDNWCLSICHVTTLQTTTLLLSSTTSSTVSINSCDTFAGMFEARMLLFDKHRCHRYFAKSHRWAFFGSQSAHMQKSYVKITQNTTNMIHSMCSSYLSMKFWSVLDSFRHTIMTHA